MQSILSLIAISSLGLTATLPALADDAHHKAHAATTAGVVRKVDKDQGKITIQHGELENLGMPAMTMVFRDKGAEMLDGMKAGDNVRFTGDKVNGAFTVTRIEAAK